MILLRSFFSFLTKILSFFSFGNREILTDVDWVDLTDIEGEGVTNLGYNQTSWNEETNSIVTIPCVEWNDLTLEQQGAAGVFDFTEETWDNELGGCPTNWWGGLSWTQLPVFLQQAAIDLGYDQFLWDNGSLIDVDCVDWADLTEWQRAAAEAMGYNEALWNASEEASGMVANRYLRRLEDAMTFSEFCGYDEEPRLLARLLCLSGYSQVQVLGKGNTFLEDVEQGDKVLVSTSASGSLDEYQKVYLFGHKDVYAVSDMLQITTSGNTDTKPLEITGGHLVLKQKSPAASGGIPVRADSIEVGDFLIGSKGVGELVTQISSVRRPGLYSPITKDGKFLANGILVSSYTAIQEKNPESYKVGSMEVASHHFMNHAALAPFRLLCLVSGGIANLCNQQNHEGRLLVVALAERLTKHGIAAILSLMFLVPVHFMEQLVGGLITMCLLPVAWLLVSRFLYISLRNKKKVSDCRKHVV